MTGSERGRTMTFQEAVDAIESIPHTVRKHTIEELRDLLVRLGSPQDHLKFIHVAGTDGKGSVCMYLGKILETAGCRVGYFLSPHLVDLRERFLFNSRQIEGEDFVTAYEVVRDKILCAPEGGEDLTYFETLFFIFLVWMQSCDSDVVILETGLGGRRDATNAVENKILTVITRIGLDHMQFLGNSLEEIAGHKAGIMRQGTPLVCLNKPEEAAEVFGQAGEALGAPLCPVSQDSFTGSLTPDGRVQLSCRMEISDDLLQQSGDSPAAWKQTASPAGREPGAERILTALLPTCALYQAENAALAVRAALVLKQTCLLQDYDPGMDALKEGLEQMTFPARMEEMADRLYVDGAHNIPAMQALLTGFRELLRVRPFAKRVLLFSAAEDKAYQEELDLIVESGLFTKVILTSMEGSRAAREEKLIAAMEAALSKKSEKAVEILTGKHKILYDTVMIGEYVKTDSVGEALALVREDLLAPDTVALCTGSLYLAGEVQSFMRS